MRFLANENFPLRSVNRLREAGYDIASITEDSPGVTDSEVLARAADEERIILTFDRDYGELIYRLRMPSPIVIARTLLLNLLPGILFGFVYWRWGLEYAILSHFWADIVLHVIGGS